MKNYERIVSCVKEGTNVIVEIPWIFGLTTPYSRMTRPSKSTPSVLA